MNTIFDYMSPSIYGGGQQSYYRDGGFNRMDRIGDDGCFIDQRSIQNTASLNYSLQNYYIRDCDFRRPLMFATAQPAINISQQHMSPCAVDASSQLLIGGVQTAPKGHIDLFPRPFVTVPYLGRGSVNTDMETRLMYGQNTISRGTNNDVRRQTYYTHQPVLEEVREYNNARFNVDYGADYMIGGLSTRNEGRDMSESR